jgi:hypothetical protein
MADNCNADFPKFDLVPMVKLWALRDDHTVYQTGDFKEYVRSLRKHHRVAATAIGQVCVSTIFSGVSHDLVDPPLPFQTLVFAATASACEAEEIEERHYASWSDAESGHRALVAKWTRLIGVAPCELTTTAPLPKAGGDAPKQL